MELAYATGNPDIAKVNGRGVLTAVAPGHTNLMVQSESTSAPAGLKLSITITAAKPPAFKPAWAVRTVKVDGRLFRVNTVTIPKGMPLTVGIANRKVGTTQPLASIAKAYNADIAINGTFFEAYKGTPDPYGNLITDGIPEHFGNVGTTIGFKWDGSAVMDTLRMKMNGTVNGSGGIKNWYAYFMNRTPTSTNAATYFSPIRGDKLGFTAGAAITIKSGVVTRIAYGENSVIPKDGYVLVFMGSESGQAKKFGVGDKVTDEVTYEDASGKALDWSQVHTAVGAGPRLVKDGKIALDPVGEGFRDPKILTGGGARSGIAILPDGSLLIATVSGATMKQWAQVMLRLGAKQAMNLDGGASSGLYYNGKTITSPGRSLSNALLFGQRLKY
jgi:exopolysaccharide biosynthesis protein